MKPVLTLITALAPRNSSAASENAADIRISAAGAEIVARKNGIYDLVTQTGKKSITVSAVPEPMPIPGPWAVTFPPNFGALPEATFANLVSWPDRPEEGIKYFSGTATYTKEIDLPAAMTAKGIEVSLDFGAVEVIAEVEVNGKSAGILWKPPFRTDITELVKPGKNLLRIRATNLWINRLSGDEFKPPYLKWKNNAPGQWPNWDMDGGPVPDTGRVTFTTWRHWTKDDKPVPSGLIGPVRIIAAEVRDVK
jgi:hypothetical protein